ncbi:MAG: hypothetical protein IKB73_04885 [Ruminococcus sp.]|nr:hypothetical protein [Ruminococcus sp.]
MVKKLFKHEFYAYLRVVFPMHIILLGIAILSRIIQLFDNNSLSYDIMFWSSVIAFIVGCVVCFLLTFVFGIRRFYSNIYSHEGYLTLTLPVNPTQHILVKNVVALTAQITSLLMILLSVCVITLGDVCVELFKVVGYVLHIAYDEVGQHTTLYIIEIILCLVISISTSFMLFYACISLGQRAKKNRVAAAVGIYCLYYFIVQVIGTIFIILVTVFSEQLRLYDLLMYLTEHPIVTNHIGFCAVIVVSGLLNLLYFAITKKTITKKLNLE